MAVTMLDHKKSYFNSVVEWGYVTVKLKYGAQAKKPTSASKTSSYSHTLLKQQILYRKNCIVYLKLYKPPL